MRTLRRNNKDSVPTSQTASGSVDGLPAPPQEQRMSIYRRPSISSLASIVSSSSKGAKVPNYGTVNKPFWSLTREDIRRPTQLNAKKLNSLQLAVYEGDVKKTQSLMAEKRRNLNKLDSVHGVTALHIAAEKGDLKMVKLLVEGIGADNHKKAASLDIHNLDGRTPLTMATMLAHFEIVSYLLSSGANANDVDRLGCVAVHYAILNEDHELVDLLIKHTNITVTDNTGKTLLHHAARLGNETLVKFLLRYGIDPSITDIDGKKPVDLVPEDDDDLRDQLLLKEMRLDAGRNISTKGFLSFENRADSDTGADVVPAHEETTVEAFEAFESEDEAASGMTRDEAFEPIESGDETASGMIQYDNDASESGESEDENRSNSPLSVSVSSILDSVKDAQSETADEDNEVVNKFEQQTQELAKLRAELSIAQEAARDNVTNDMASFYTSQLDGLSKELEQEKTLRLKREDEYRKILAQVAKMEADMQQARESYEAEKERLSSDVRMQESDAVKLRLEHESLQKEAEAQNGRICSLETELGQVQEKLQKSEVSVKTMEDQWAQAHHAAATLKRKLDIAVRDLGKKTEEVNRLRVEAAAARAADAKQEAQKQSEEAHKLNDRVKELERVVSDAEKKHEEEVETLKTELIDAQFMLADAEREEIESMQRNWRLVCEIRDLERQLESITPETFKALRAESEEWERRAREAEADGRKYRDELAQFDIKIGILETENGFDHAEAIRRKLWDAEQRNLELLAEAADLQGKLEAQAKAFAFEKDQLEAVIFNLRRTTSSDDELKEEVVTLRAKLAAAKAEINTMDKEFEEMENKLKKLDGTESVDVTGLRDQLAAAEAEKDVMEKEMTTMEESFEQILQEKLDAQAKVFASEKDQLEAVIFNLRRTISSDDELKEEFESTADATNLVEQVAAAEDEKRQMQIEKEKLQEKLTDERRKVQMVKRELESAQLELVSMKTQLEFVESENTIMESELRKVKEAYGKLVGTDEKRTKAEADLAVVRETLRAAESKVTVMESKVELMGDLEKRCIQAESKATILENTVTTMTNEKQTLERSNTRYREQLVKLKHMYTATKKSLQEKIQNYVSALEVQTRRREQIEEKMEDREAKLRENFEKVIRQYQGQIEGLRKCLDRKPKFGQKGGWVVEGSAVAVEPKVWRV